jgi:hypothetical protein
VSLNVWGGVVLDPLLAFVREQAPRTDLFCFQEALDAPELIPLECRFHITLYRVLTELLPEFAGAFVPVVAWDQPRDDGPPIRVPYGLATFARRSLPILRRRNVHIIDHQDTLDAVPGLHPVTRWLQVSEIRVASGSLMVGNFHGMARPGTKLDSPERIEQSRGVRRVLDAHAGPILLTGDFNLLPETESVRILGEGRHNLVLERGIPTTRSRLNTFYGTPQEQPHANYAIVSPDIRVLDFQVPDLAISDHLPMLMELGF